MVFSEYSGFLHQKKNIDRHVITEILLNVELKQSFMSSIKDIDEVLSVLYYALTFFR